MTHALLIFGATYIAVFTLGLQSLNVNQGHYFAAAVTSLGIGAGHVMLYRYMPSADAVELGGYFAGGVAGITSSMWFHRRAKAAIGRWLSRAEARRVAAAAIVTLATPELKKGETYVGAIIGPDGNGAHVILLPGDKSRITWTAALKWAKEQDGDLPSRLEQAMLFAHLRDQFEHDWYWSNTQLAGDERWAWYQYFGYGNQSYNTKDFKLRARAVRRVSI